MKRFDYVDIARGLGILLVIMGHIQHDYVPFCGSVHIPLFFIMSGYLYELERDSYKPFSQMVKKRAVRLLVPYFLYNLVLYAKYILSMLVSGEFLAKTAVDAVLGFLYSSSILYKGVPSEANFNGFVFGNGPLWFLTAMVVSSVVFYGITYFVLKQKFDLKKIIVAAVALVAASWLLCTYLPFYLPWTFEMALLGTVFMLMGLSLRRYKVVEKMQDNLRVNLAVCLACLVVFAGLHYFNGSANMAILVYGKSMVVYLVLGLLGTIIVLGISVVIARVLWLNRFLTYVGQNTLIILAFHMTIISIVIAVLNKIGLESLVEWGGLFLITFPAGLFGCIIINEFLTKVIKFPKKYL